MEQKYKFTIYVFDEKTRQIKGTATYETKPVTEKRIKELLNREVKKYKNACYQVETL